MSKLPKNVQEYIFGFLHDNLTDEESNHQLNIMEAVAQFMLEREEEKRCEWKEYSKEPFHHFKPSCPGFTDTAYIAYAKPRDGSYCPFCGGKIIAEEE